MEISPDRFIQKVFWRIGMVFIGLASAGIRMKVAIIASNAMSVSFFFGSCVS